MVITLLLTTILLPRCIKYALRVLVPDDKCSFVVLREESPELRGPGLLSLFLLFNFPVLLR